MSMSSTLHARLPAGCSRNSRYSKNQTAMFTPLTSVNRPHHQASGFDQAKRLDRAELDRAGHSKLMGRPRVSEPTFIRGNSVTDCGPVAIKMCMGPLTGEN